MTGWLKRLDLAKILSLAGVALGDEPAVLSTAEILDQVFGHDTMERMPANRLADVLVEYLRKKEQFPITMGESFT